MRKTVPFVYRSSAACATPRAKHDSGREQAQSPNFVVSQMKWLDQRLTAAEAISRSGRDCSRSTPCEYDRHAPARVPHRVGVRPVGQPRCTVRSHSCAADLPPSTGYELTVLVDMRQYLFAFGQQLDLVTIGRADIDRGHWQAPC